MKHLDSFPFQNQRFLIRVDYNVPMDSDLKITDDTRMRATLPTINKIISSGGSVVLMSHRGRPKGQDDSLKYYSVTASLGYFHSVFSSNTHQIYGLIEFNNWHTIF